MPKGVLALNLNGDLTYCTAPEELRGKGRCNHLAHQGKDEDTAAFLDRISEKMDNIKNHINVDPEDEGISVEGKEITQEEIDAYAAKLDEIAGQKVTMDNINQIMATLTPKQISDIAKIGFEAAPEFSLPITDENYEDEVVKNQLYFANLPSYGIAGNAASLEQMFKSVGIVQTAEGTFEIKNSYKEGLTDEEYFAKQYSARDALYNKGVATSKPGFTARKLFYCMSDTMVVDDCGGPHIDALHCKMPEGHVCRKCANMTKGGETIKPGDLVGGLVSTNMSEALTQLSMKNMHPLFGKQVVEIYRNESEFKIITDGPVKNGKDSLGRSYCSTCPICGREFRCAASHKEAWCGNCHVEYKCPICEEECSTTSIKGLKQLENNEIFYHNHECYIKSKQFAEQNRIMASHWIEPCDKCGDNFASHSILSGCNTCNNRTSASIEHATRLGKKWYKINLERYCYNIKFCNICKKDTLHHGDKCTKCYPENSTRDPQYEQFCPICGENTIWYAGKCTICYPEFKQICYNNLGKWIKPISYNHCIICGIETPHKYNDNNELYCQVCSGERVWCEHCQKWETINYNSQKEHWLFYKSITKQWISNNQSLLEKVQNIIEGDYSILLNSHAISGVYGWFLNGTCLYIGKSVDIYSRSLDHIMNMWLYPEEWYMITPYIDTFPANNKLELLILETSNNIEDGDLWHSELQWINKLNPDSQKCDGTDHIRSLHDRTKIIK